MKRITLDVAGIVFDLDGTIVDSRQAYSDAAEQAFSECGRERPSIETVKEIRKRLELGRSLDELIRGIDEEKFRSLRQSML